MTIKLIVATDQNSGIGRDSKLPWGCPNDLKYFKEVTSNSTVVMGRTTFDSLGRKGGLPNRFNVVVSSSWDYESGNVQTTCLENLVGNITNPKWTDGDDVWIIGGASIYKQLLPYVEEIHHTLIDGVYDCDTFFDMSFLKDWKLVGGKDLAENAILNIWRKDGKS